MLKKIPIPILVTLYSFSAHASLEGAMYSLKTQISTVFLPALSLIGIVFAGISLAMGHQNAKNHISMAVIGAIVGFGADNIIDFVRRTFGGV